MHSTLISEHLKRYGQQLETAIATAMGLPLDEVQSSLSKMSMRGEVSRCSVTRFIDGNRIDDVIYRPLGYIPPKIPGRKPGDR